MRVVIVVFILWVREYFPNIVCVLSAHACSIENFLLRSVCHVMVQSRFACSGFLGCEEQVCASFRPWPLSSPMSI